MYSAHGGGFSFTDWCFLSVDGAQFKGRMFLTWTDQSGCESGFILTRDGKGFSQQYDFSSDQICGIVHSPQVIFDDFTMQPGPPALVASKNRSP